MLTALLLLMGSALAATVAAARSPLGRAVRVQFNLMAERSGPLPR